MRRTVLGKGVWVFCSLASSLLPTVSQSQDASRSIPCGAAHVVAAGDSLGSLAAQVYGDPTRYDILMTANRDLIGDDPDNLPIGLSILIPCLDASGQPMTTEAAAQANAEMQAAIAAQGPLHAEDLDTLFGPVALFSDPLLTQVLMAATFPLDVVKADRAIRVAPDLPEKDRAAFFEKQPWDPSVQQLAAGFPELITRMADHIDWTEQAGDAVVAQTDDVLASIQRLRTKAQENGYLADNEAQSVNEVDGVISIVPANSSVIYVPTYDSQVIYTTPMASAAPYDPYYYGYDNNDWSDALAAGAIIFGGALILDEIFDNDDYRGAWWDNGGTIDWQGGDIIMDRDTIDIDRGNIGEAGRPAQVKRPENWSGRIGGAEEAALAGKPDRAFAPDPASREVARKKIETRTATSARPATFPASRPVTKPAATRPSAGANSKARTPSASRPTQASRPAQVAKPTATRRPSPSATSRSAHKTAFQPTGGARASAGASRGRASSGGRRSR